MKEEIKRFIEENKSKELYLIHYRFGAYPSLYSLSLTKIYNIKLNGNILIYKTIFGDMDFAIAIAIGDITLFSYNNNQYIKIENRYGISYIADNKSTSKKLLRHYASKLLYNDKLKLNRKSIISAYKDQIRNLYQNDNDIYYLTNKG